MILTDNNTITRCILARVGSILKQSCGDSTFFLQCSTMHLLISAHFKNKSTLCTFCELKVTASFFKIEKNDAEIKDSRELWKM